jgi:hypothetical protein
MFLIQCFPHNLGCKTTPVASLKSQGCQEKQQHIPSNEKVVNFSLFRCVVSGERRVLPLRYP